MILETSLATSVQFDDLKAGQRLQLETDWGAVRSLAVQSYAERGRCKRGPPFGYIKLNGILARGKALELEFTAAVGVDRHWSTAVQREGHSQASTGSLMITIDDKA